MKTQITIYGYVVGAIWWPAGAECFKEFTYDLTREKARKLNSDFRSHIRVRSPAAAIAKVRRLAGSWEEAA